MIESIQVNSDDNKKSRVSKTESIALDVISNLPESIVSHILSLLPTKDAVRTCVLSKDWEYKWMNIENIDIDDSVLFNHPSIENESFVQLFSHPRIRKKSVVNFVDMILFFCPVKRFRLQVSETFDKVRVVTWISALVSRNVQSIDLTCYRGAIDIPCCLFDSPSLINLKLHLTCTLRVPTKNWFSNIKKLYLSKVKIVNELFPITSQLIFTFPVLESLELQYCIWLGVELVEINAPSLKRFNSCNSLSGCSYLIKISGAKLETFETSSFFPENIILSESSVKYAAIGDDYRVCSDETDIQNGLQARKLLKGCTGLKHLKLSYATFSGFCLTKSEYPLPVFDGLKQLEIGIVHRNGAFLELLHAAPSLETLIINAKRWSTVDYELESVPPCVVSHLKEVKFHGFHGFDEQIQLAEYLLKNAVKLGKMLGLSRKKYIENPIVHDFWVMIKRVLENGDLDLGDKIRKYV